MLTFLNDRRQYVLVTIFILCFCSLFYIFPPSSLPEKPESPPKVQLECTTGIKSPPMNWIRRGTKGFKGYNEEEGITFYYEPPVGQLCVVSKL